CTAFPSRARSTVQRAAYAALPRAGHPFAPVAPGAAGRPGAAWCGIPAPAAPLRTPRRPATQRAILLLLPGLRWLRTALGAPYRVLHLYPAEQAKRQRTLPRQRPLLAAGRLAQRAARPTTQLQPSGDTPCSGQRIQPGRHAPAL